MLILKICIGILLMIVFTMLIDSIEKKVKAHFKNFLKGELEQKKH